MTTTYRYLFADLLTNTIIAELPLTGVAFCQSIFGVNTNWVQTSYNGNMRGKYAGIGDIYDETNDEFYTPVSDVVNVDSTVIEQTAITQ